MPMDDHPNYRGKEWPVSPVQNRFDNPRWPLWTVIRVFACGVLGFVGLIGLCIAVAVFGKL